MVRLKAFIKIVQAMPAAADVKTHRVESNAQTVADVDPHDASVVFIMDRSGSMANHMLDVQSHVCGTIEQLSRDLTFTVIAVSDTAAVSRPWSYRVAMQTCRMR